MNNIKIEETCNTCEFNFDGICNVDGTQKYTENIINKTNTCEEWEPSLEYFKYAMLNAPRFLREKLNDCTIGVNKFITLFHDYASGIGRPINIFDAIKYIYGISMVDIYEDGHIKHHSGLGRAIVGGVLFGAGGAVVGALTKTPDEEIHTALEVRIIVKGKNEPIILPFWDSQTYKSYNERRLDAVQVMTILMNIKNGQEYFVTKEDC